MTELGKDLRVMTPKSRRAFIGLAFGAVGLLAAGAAQAQDGTATAQRIAQHFSNVKTMMGKFAQFGPRGEQSEGKFYIERPGKLRFDYEGNARFRVISDGSTVVLENRKMNTADIYSLNQTPLKLLLAERIDLSGGKLQGVQVDDDATVIRMVDKQVFGNSTITMTFDSKTYELRQWTVTDAQGKDTTIVVYDVQQGVKFDQSVFHIDYRRVNAMSANK
jgi:outer membrane lipoprotein-sorting protein